ncbi:hypothetical protein ABWL39_07185 [Chitinivorax sp. PXF-14]|uniref:hypothetical protein n=1 Tax=Chitinivorax sp. PXF-14 TaxID=3230488 RepID=UPI003467E91E
MLNHDQVAELHARFVWRDVTEGGVLPGIGWSQSICVAADHLRIWSDPQPDFMSSGAHGLHVMVVSDGTCLLTRQYTDARRVDFAVAASLGQVVEILLMDDSHKVGVAADALLDKPEKEELLTRTKVIGRV